MKRRCAGVIAVIAMLGGLGGAGCGGTAVLVARSAHGGILGLDGDREQAMADARRVMSEACGGVYTIVGERTVLAGTYHGRTLSERQVRFMCGEHPEVPAPAPVPDDL